MDFYSNKIACFLKQGDKRWPLHEYLGIFRLMFRGGKHLAIFELAPEYADVCPPLTDGIIEVRYIEVGRLNNPNNGIPLMTIEILEEKDAWINRLSSLEYRVQKITIRFMVRCKITWADGYNWQLYRKSNTGRGRQK